VIGINAKHDTNHFFGNIGSILLTQIACMNSTTFHRNNKVVEAGLDQPAISIILPFEPKMNPKSEIVDRLKSALDKVQQEVIIRRNDDISVLVIQKLRNLIKSLNFSTYKKSIVIYVSPVFEKVLYLDIPVEERITINEPFDIRQLILNRKPSHQFLLLVLNEYCSNIYLGNDSYLNKLKSNIPHYIKSIKREITLEKQFAVDSASDAIEERLMRVTANADEGLGALLPAYPLPVFVIGPENVVNNFKTSTTHKKTILEYGYINSDQLSPSELLDIIKPLVCVWQRVKVKYLQQQLDEVINTNKLSSGIGNVWKVASEGKGRLLIIEEDYRYAAQLLESEDGLYTSKEPYHKYSHVRDAVDDIIEIVLDNGGDVEFVEKGLLDRLKPIALIQ
jgi:hypothetical protein